MPGQAVIDVHDEPFYSMVRDLMPRETEAERLYRESTRKYMDKLREEIKARGQQARHAELGRRFAEAVKMEEQENPAKVQDMKSSVMSWICRNGHHVAFWRNECAACGARAAGFEGSTYGVGFPD